MPKSFKYESTCRVTFFLEFGVSHETYVGGFEYTELVHETDIDDMELNTEFKLDAKLSEFDAEYVEYSSTILQMACSLGVYVDTLLHSVRGNALRSSR